jgi:uncharacterized RmlC-like cupin family protein
MRAWSKRIAVLLLSGAAPLAPGLTQESGVDAEIITVRPAATTDTKQGLPNFVGISGKNAGTRHISMNKVIIPPGGGAKAHMHKGFESVTDQGAGEDALWGGAHEERHQ